MGTLSTNKLYYSIFLFNYILHIYFEVDSNFKSMSTAHTFVNSFHNTAQDTDCIAIIDWNTHNSYYIVHTNCLFCSNIFPQWHYTHRMCCSLYSKNNCHYTARMCSWEDQSFNCHNNTHNFIIWDSKISIWNIDYIYNSNAIPNL